MAPQLNAAPARRILRRTAGAVFGRGRGIGLLILLVLAVLRVLDPAPLQILRVKTFDIYQRIKPRVVDQRPVTIVDIDEDSLREIGQWPWPRTVVAELVSRLTGMGAAAIGFDVVFPEADRMSPASVATALAGLPDDVASSLKALPSNDEVLAQALGMSRVVVGQSVRSGAPPNDEPPPSSVQGFIGGDPRKWVVTYDGLVQNLPVLNRAAMGHGMFNVAPELDGVVRRVPMILNVDGTLYPALSAELLRVATGNSTIAVKSDPVEGIEGIVIRPNLIRTDNGGKVWVYFSRHDPEKYVSAVDVLNGTVPPEKIAGRLLLLGTSAVGLLDIKASPLDSFLPGVEVHAQILENVLTGTQLQYPRDATALEVLGTLLVGILMVIVVPMAGARLSLGLLVLAVASAAGLSWWQFADRLTLYDPVFAVLSAVILYMYLSYAGYAREEQQRRQVRDAFSRYMSPALVERLAQDPSQLRLGGEMRDMTLLFCDVRGFTTISETFRDNPEGLTRLINQFLTPMTNVILQRRGTIDKYMGDCIMAFWNAPLDDDEHAANACRSALAMIDCTKSVNVQLAAEAEREGRAHHQLNIGIGLNSGMVCVGNMGSDQRFDYSVLGDNVNLASRLEGQSKTYGVTVVIGENTKNEVPEFATLELDLIRVKGKQLPVRIFALLGDEAFAATADFKALRNEHDAMLDAYRAQQWVEAKAHLAACRDLDPGLGLGILYDLYEGRIDDYLENAPGDQWDGVYVALTK